MKFTKIIVMVTIILQFIVLMLCGCGNAYIEESEGRCYYPTCGIVTVVDTQKDIVIVEDFCGNQWEFKGCEDWAEGDICAMLMNDKGTAFIYDDEIIQTRYCGYLEE